MNRNSYLSHRAREVFLDGQWIANTNYQQLIGDLTWEEATEKIDDLNTIAALVFHINYYVAGLLHAFEHGKLEIHDKFSFEMPPVQSGEDWEKLKHSFLGNAARFAEAVAQMPDSRFDETFFDPKYGNYNRNIEGIIEHAYYHMGQVSLLRKMILKKNRRPH